MSFVFFGHEKPDEFRVAHSEIVVAVVHDGCACAGVVGVGVVLNGGGRRGFRRPVLAGSSRHRSRKDAVDHTRTDGCPVKQ